MSDIAEGALLDRLPLLDPKMFIYWKKHFEVFVKSKSLRLWRIIQSGDYVPYKVSIDEMDVIVKPESEWSEEDETKVRENYLAIHILYCAIPKKEIGIILKCETAQNIWETLVTTYEGNSIVIKEKPMQHADENDVTDLILKCDQTAQEKRETLVTTYEGNSIVLSEKCMQHADEIDFREIVDLGSKFNKELGRKTETKIKTRLGCTERTETNIELSTKCIRKNEKKTVTRLGCKETIETIIVLYNP